MAFEFVGQTIKAQVTKGVTAARQAAVGTAEEYLGPKAISTMGDLYSKASSKLGDLLQRSNEESREATNESTAKSTAMLGEQIEEAQGRSTYGIVQAVGELNESIDDIRDVVVLMGEESEFQLKKMRKEMGDSISGSFLKRGIFGKLLGPIGKIFSPFRKLFTPLGKLIGLLGPIGRGLGPLMKLAVPMLGKAGLVGMAGAVGYGIGKLINLGIDKLFGEKGGLGKWVYDMLHGEAAEKIKDMVGWVKDLGLSILEWSPIKFVGKAIGRLVDWFKELDFSTAFEKVREIGITIFQYWPPVLIYKGIRGLIDWFKELDFSTAFEKVKEVAGMVLQFWPPVLIYKGIKGLVEWFKELDIGETITTLKESVGKFFAISPIELLRGKVSGLVDWFGTFSIDEAVEQIKGFVDRIVQMPVSLISKVISNLSSWFEGFSFSDALESIKEQFGQLAIFDPIVGSIKEAIKWIGEKFSLENMLKVLTSGLEAAAGKLGWLGKKALTLAGIGGIEKPTTTARPVVEEALVTKPTPVKPVVSEIVVAKTAPITPATEAFTTRGTPSGVGGAGQIKVTTDNEETVGLLGSIKGVLSDTKELLGRFLGTREPETMREFRDDPLAVFLGSGRF